MDINTIDLVKTVFLWYAVSVFIVYSIMIAFEIVTAKTRYDIHAAFSGELLLIALVWFIVLPIAAVIWGIEHAKEAIEKIADYIADKRGL